ncbi:carboxymuconolactone decarboxylase family protein [Isoptericola halotolerans]|uniref:carboxymuconolactone decarboxylase family protein n=1 Tax=Isoptericola halotolerans TaxID=300560 RepID=UPI003891032A
MDYGETLQRLMVNDARIEDGQGLEPGVLSAKLLALVRLAAVVAVGGSAPTYGTEIDAALNAGASAAEIVDVLCAIVPVVGVPNVVAAAPDVALALGFEPFES